MQSGAARLAIDDTPLGPEHFDEPIFAHLRRDYVPIDVRLTVGNHREIQRWQQQQSLKRTRERRRDLLPQEGVDVLQKPQKTTSKRKRRSRSAES